MKLHIDWSCSSEEVVEAIEEEMDEEFELNERGLIQVVSGREQDIAAVLNQVGRAFQNSVDAKQEGGSK